MSSDSVLFSNRAPLAYQHAFDLCAVIAGGQPVRLVAEGHHADELRARLTVTDADSPACVIWATPEISVTAETVTAGLTHGARVCAIVAGGFTAEKPSLAGFRLVTRYGFRTPLSLVWGVVYPQLERMNQPHLADRFAYRMRAGYSITGWLARWCAVQVCVWEKG